MVDSYLQLKNNKLILTSFITIKTMNRSMPGHLFAPYKLHVISFFVSYKGFLRATWRQIHLATA